MADERDRRWLDEAAAEKLLRGEPLEPSGPAADPRARAEAARLRAALDSLARPQAPAGALAGEAAAMAAFRAARAAGTSGAIGSAAARPATGEPLVELVGHTGPRSVRRGRTVRFGLAAALASVTVGGLAAAAAAGLLGQDGYDVAGPGPAVSVSIDEDQAKGVGTGAPTHSPQVRPNPHRGDEAVPDQSPSGAQPTGPDGLTSWGGSAIGGNSSGGSTAGGRGGDSRDTGGTRGSEIGGATGGRDSAGAEGGAKDRDKDRDKDRSGQGQDDRLLKAADLCKEYKVNRLTIERRERLSLLARGVSRIPAYCDSLLIGATAGGRRGDSPGQDAPSQPRTPVPAGPGGGFRNAG
ncbi:hypothetical protein [Streptomyces sp. NPDC096339]|uniref:hypothetical protein n=1 Tax=Streptomyces sp. NPDC096339 TaxID=3366086 RepID=UPI0037FAC8C5